MDSAEQFLIAGILLAALVMLFWRLVLFVVVIVSIGIVFAGLLAVASGVSGGSLLPN